ncbi:hypothetical protein KKA95_04075 [Patescibacteria group bacterium]|nr:hypothetical protein [Patescibacteria group bacterium]
MQELQELVSKLQGYIQLDTLDKIVSSYNDLSEEDKNAVMNTLKYWVAKVDLINEYDTNRTAAINKGLNEMHAIEGKMKNDYKGAFEEIEKQEDISSTKEAEELIKQI